MPESSEPPLLDSNLIEHFEHAARPDPSTHLVGTELEKFGVVSRGEHEPLQPVGFANEIWPVFQGLIEQHGWAAGDDRGTHGEVVALQRDGASITLEPGGQLELSGAPLPNVHDTCAEFTQHYSELDDVSQPLNLTWFAAGFHPWATREDIQWMPKGRYQIMRSYLPTRGAMALDMMLRTCTVQANFDYASEAQCGQRFRLATAIAPLVTALFANSPFMEGRAADRQSLRSHVWTAVDPDRCGIPPFVFEEPFSYEKYVDWALDVPMFFVKRQGIYHQHHDTFRTFMKRGFVDPAGVRHQASFGDWLTHLSTVFPEVRLKPHIELRSADAVGSRYVCGLPALLKGILYDDDASQAAWELVKDLRYAERIELWHNASKHGMHAEPIRDKVRTLLTLARDALDRADVRDSQGRTESRFLDRLEPLADTGTSPGDAALTQLGPSPGRDPKAQHRFAQAFHFAGVFG